MNAISDDTTLKENQGVKKKFDWNFNIKVELR